MSSISRLNNYDDGIISPAVMMKLKGNFGKGNLAGMLEEVAPALRAAAAPLTADALREKIAANRSRIVDLFRKFDTDNSGSIDLKEFKKAVAYILPSARESDVEELFAEFDAGGDGAVSYTEMFETIRQTIKKRREIERERRQLPPPPTLPRELHGRKREVMALHQQYIARKSAAAASRAAARGPFGGATDGIGGGAGAGGGMDLLGSGQVPNFEAALRLYYPKDNQATTNILCKFVSDALAARAAAAELKVLENDNALVAALDSDGNGTISLSEFLELSKATGLSRNAMRETFRRRDYGNSGELTIEQMREVLRDLRDEAAKSRAAVGLDALDALTPTAAKPKGGGSANSALMKAAARAGIG